MGPDIRAAPLSDVKKTKVFLSIPRLCSDVKMRPTQWSSSITASPYLQEGVEHTAQLKSTRTGFIHTINKLDTLISDVSDSGFFLFFL